MNSTIYLKDWLYSVVCNSRLKPSSVKSNSVNEDGKLSMDNSIINSSHELESVTTPLGQVALVKSENDKLNKPKLPSSDAFVKSRINDEIWSKAIENYCIRIRIFLKLTLSKFVSANSESVNVELDKFAPLKFI